MTPIQNISPHLEGRLKSDFRTWQLGGPDLSFDSALHPEFVGKLTTSFVARNGQDISKILLADGPFKVNGEWKNMEDADNVFLIENAYHMSNEIYQLGDWRINIPKPKGLYLNERESMRSLYPAFVARYVHNSFF